MKSIGLITRLDGLLKIQKQKQKQSKSSLKDIGSPDKRFFHLSQLACKWPIQGQTEMKNSEGWCAKLFPQ